MSIRIAAVAAAFTLYGGIQAAAASLDLAAIGKMTGATITSATDVNIIFDGPNDFFLADVDDLSFSIDAFPSDRSSATVFIDSPPFAGGSPYFGFLVDLMLDVSGAEALFSDDGSLGGDLVLVRATFPADLVSLPGPTDVIDTVQSGTSSGVDVTILDVVPIPLPAALPLALAGFGGLALLGGGRGRRSRASVGA
jgi:hypothetical protein